MFAGRNAIPSAEGIVQIQASMLIPWLMIELTQQMANVLFWRGFHHICTCVHYKSLEWQPCSLGEAKSGNLPELWREGGCILRLHAVRYGEVTPTGQSFPSWRPVLYEPLEHAGLSICQRKKP